MIYEHRSYSLLPGKRQEFIETFEKFMPNFDKYGAKVVGVWQTDIGENNEFIYILAFQNFAQREEFWNNFRKDKAFLEYQRQGPYAAKVTNKILRPTKYSPLK